MSDIFISYSRQDAEFVAHLKSRLSDEGRDAWIDVEDIPPSSAWRRDISEGIEGANAFVFVLSTASLASPECAKEITHAVNNHKRIIPIVCQQVDADVVPMELRELNWINFLDPLSFENDFATLLLAVDTNLDWVRAHTRLQVQALQWQNAGHEASLLLRGIELLNAENLLVSAAPGKSPPSTPLQEHFVVESRAAATRRRNTLAGSAFVLFVMLGAATWIANAQYQRATAERQRGDEQAKVAKLQTELAAKEKSRAELADQQAKQETLRKREQEALKRAAQAFEVLYRNPYEALQLADLSLSGKPLPEGLRALELAFRTAAKRAENRRDYSALTGSGPGYLAMRWRQGDVYSQVSPTGRHVLLVSERAPDGSHTEEGKEMAGDVYLLDQETGRVRELKGCNPADRRRVEYVGFDSTGQRVLVTRQFNLQVYSLDGTCQGQAGFSAVTKSPIHLAGGYALGRFVLGADSKGGIWYTAPDSKSFHTIRHEWTRENDPAVMFVISPDGRAATIVFESGRASEILFKDSDKFQERKLRNRGVLAAAYRPDRKGALALGGDDGCVYLFDQGKSVGKISVANTALEEIGFADGGQRLVAITADQTVVLIRMAGRGFSHVRFPLGEYDREVRRVPSPRVKYVPKMCEILGEPVKRESITEKIVKTEAAEGREFLYVQEENHFWPVVAYISDGSLYRSLRHVENRIIKVREELGRAYLITENNQLLTLEKNYTQSLLPSNVRFVNAKVVDGKLWVGTSAGLFAVGDRHVDQLLEVRGSVYDIVPHEKKVWLATERGAFCRDDDGWFYRVTEGFRRIRSIHLDGKMVWMLTGTDFEPGPALLGSGLRFQAVPGRASRVQRLDVRKREVVLMMPQGEVRYRNGVKQ